MLRMRRPLPVVAAGADEVGEGECGAQKIGIHKGIVNENPSMGLSNQWRDDACKTTLNFLYSMDCFAVNLLAMTALWQ